MSVSDRVRALVESPLADLGFEVVDVEHAGATLRITLDRPEGIDADALEAPSKLLSELLDRDDPVPGRYTLEVSSPGVERPLRTPAHFRRFVGETVAVKTAPAVEGDRRVEGVLEAADDEGVVVAGRRLAYQEIERARTVFTWGPQAKPGKGKKKANA